MKLYAIALLGWLGYILHTFYTPSIFLPVVLVMGAILYFSEKDEGWKT